MRKTLALVALAVTSMVSLAFLIPFGLMIKQIAHDTAMSEAERQAVALAPVLATTGDPTTIATAASSTRAGQAGRLAVHLPGGAVLGSGRATPADLRAATTQAKSVTSETEGGLVLLQPIALADARVALTEVYVPDADLTRGVLRSWLVLTGVGIALVLGSVLVADRLGARMVRSARHLAAAAGELGNGDLSVRVDPQGPRELAQAGHAFNQMAGRVRQLLAAERELIADLSHRLRTPLTALRLSTAQLGAGEAGTQARLAVDRLEEEVDRIISSARRSAAEAPGSCDATAVLRERLGFWSALAEDQDRPWDLRGAGEPAPVPVPGTEFAAAVDALLGNVFLHTPQGTGFTVSLHRSDGVVGLVVADEGPGIADPDQVLRRGHSGSGSSGLGLDIVRRVAESTGGGVTIDRSAGGGARVRMTLWQDPISSRSRPGRRRRAAH